MVVFVSDVHCRFEVVNHQVEASEARFSTRVSEVIILGDLGLMEPHLRRFLGRGGPGFQRPVSFIEGNHEDFDTFDKLVARYRDALTHLGRGAVAGLGQYKCLCIGGAAYMDAHTTPERSVISTSDIERCLAYPPDTVDVILSHDCPRGLGLTNRPGFDHYGETGFEGGDAIARHFQPSYWLFGHHHRCFHTTVAGTTYIGLPQSWQGYAVLTDDGAFELVENRVSRALPARRWFRWLIRRPEVS